MPEFFYLSPWRSFLSQFKDIFIIPPNRPDFFLNLTSASSWIPDHNLRAFRAKTNYKTPSNANIKYSRTIISYYKNTKCFKKHTNLPSIRNQRSNFRRPLASEHGHASLKRNQNMNTGQTQDPRECTDVHICLSRGLRRPIHLKVGPNFSLN